ncbi:MAG: hypothetical protein L0Y54_17660 [Sporichthyaceae bacterium]|nr:hypothetical protein [Sporichthyaceae bacterium]
MSTLSSVGRALADTVRGRFTELVRQVRRSTPGPAVVRAVTGLAALVALGVAAPLPVLLSSKAALLVPIALGAGVFPRTRWVTGVALLAVAEWVAATVGFGEAVQLGRVALLASSLYVMHSGSALLAVLPYDCAVPSGVLLRWAGRVFAVLLVSLGLGLGGMELVGQLPAVRTVAGTIIGSALAAGLAGLLAWHLRRR